MTYTGVRSKIQLEKSKESPTETRELEADEYHRPSLLQIFSYSPSGAGLTPIFLVLQKITECFSHFQ